MRRVLLTCTAVIAAAVFCGADWLQFRGAGGAGVSRDEAPPAKWSESENIAWTADLPGRAASGPIVVKGRVFLTASSGENEDRLHVLCFDTKTGDEVWRRYSKRLKHASAFLESLL